MLPSSAAVLGMLGMLGLKPARLASSLAAGVPPVAALRSRLTALSRLRRSTYACSASHERSLTAGKGLGTSSAARARLADASPDEVGGAAVQRQVSEVLQDGAAHPGSAA